VSEGADARVYPEVPFANMSHADRSSERSEKYQPDHSPQDTRAAALSFSMCVAAAESLRAKCEEFSHVNGKKRQRKRGARKGLSIRKRPLCVMLMGCKIK
jgi:hypothetical protein